MNVRKTIFVIGGIGIILILLAIRLGWINTSQKQNQTPENSIRQETKRTTSKPQTPPKTKPAVPGESTPAVSVQKKTGTAVAPAAGTEEKDLLGSGDPFVYSSAGTGDYTPVSGSRNVGAITVKGIIRIAGEEPKAILHLKDSDRVHYVSRNSVVRISTRSKKGASPAEAYIVVKDIRNDEVELIQLERPDKVIIIR